MYCLAAVPPLALAPPACCREGYQGFMGLMSNLGPNGAYLPFGAGPRACLGASLAMAEMLTFLALLARRYEVSVDADTAWRKMPLPVPKNGLPMSVRRRRQQ